MTATRSPEEFERMREAAATETDEVADQGRPGAGARHARPALHVEDLAWLFVLVVAAMFRFASLATVPLSAAEGARALETWSVAQGRLPASWPGSIVDAGTLAVFRLFGSGDGAARLLPALAGVLLVAAFWLLRPFVGRVPALAAALLAAISPIFILDARTVGGDALGAALALLLASLVLRFLDSPRPRLFVAICVALSFGLATDAVFLGSAVLIGVWLAVRRAWRRDEDFSAAWEVVRRYQDWWRSAAPLSLAGLLLATSRFGVGFARLRPAALRSWALAFTRSRPDVPWHYPLDVLAGYELPLVLLAAAGMFLVIRERHHRLKPVHALLLTWLAGGLLLNLFMAGRFTSLLLLALLPAGLLAGIAVEYLMRECAFWRFESVDPLLAGGLVAAFGYLYISSLAFLGAAESGVQTVIGVLLIVVCLVGFGVRWQRDGIAGTAPGLAVLAAAALLFSLHGASAIVTGDAAHGTVAVTAAGGDEFALGQRTTAEAVTAARLLVSNGGGVSTVTDESLPVLAWYLRDTAASGGHGGARLIPAGAPVPSGFHTDGSPTVLSRSWSPRSWSASGMLRWWIERVAWGKSPATHDVGGQLVVENR